ncbi:MAG: thymidine kinase [Actinomycetia bacterium]|nr:thymidine kinase [Actinomycetes bacterium]MCP4959954.1 thymidine kinase [Actinomycetes bacterium]
MAKLRFYFGTMGAGKSTMALQIHHNLSNSATGLLLTKHDREGAAVSSALGVSVDARTIGDTDDVWSMIEAEKSVRGGLGFAICDEAQFYSRDQIDQLVRVVDELDVDVYAFGLLTDFRGYLFDGTSRLLETADERNELQVQSRCWCGALATHNARLVDGVQIYEGDIVLVDDGHEASVTYELKCRRHWNDGSSAPLKEGLRAV